MMEQRNLIIAIALSLAILLGFQYFYKSPLPPTPPPGQSTAQSTPGAPSNAAASNVPGAPGGPAPAATGQPIDRNAALAAAPRVKIHTARVDGSIALVGGRVDDITLANYRETTDPKSPNITVLNPAPLDDAYYADFGWVADGNATPVPGPDTRWTADRETLTADQPVTLSWDNGQGVKFLRQFSIDQNFMITVAQRVENTGSATVTLYPYSLISRTGTPHTLGYYILHEGMIGVLNGTLREHKYTALKDEPSISENSTGGWVGITDKYWLVALAPDQKEQLKTRFAHTTTSGVDRYQADYLGSARTLAPGQSVEANNRLFAGAKEVMLLKRYTEDLGIERFDYAVDWGYFWFLTKPIFLALDWLYHQVGNFGIAILILTVSIKLLFFPLANRSYAMMSKMKMLQPKMTELREQFGDDKVRINQEMMALYKREKVNPLSGCLPMVLQIPVFFSLYKVLFVTIEMRHAPFYGWIHDLSAPDPTTFANLFGLIPWSPPHFLMLGAWPLIMGVTMFLQQRLNPQPADPVQAKVFMVMPVVFTVMLANFPSGLVIYWAWNNTLSIAQQWLIMKRAGAA